jgi:hypothetical protein
LVSLLIPCIKHSLLDFEPVDAGVEYPDLQEEEFMEQAPTKGGGGGVNYSLRSEISVSNFILT